MSEMILTDADLMDATHWPVTVTFSLYDDMDPNCASVACDASEGAGYSFNDKGLSFWGELDEYDQANEEPFDVECFVVHDSCKLTFGEFYHYMELACRRYAERFPEKARELETDIARYAARFLWRGHNVSWLVRVSHRYQRKRSRVTLRGRRGARDVSLTSAGRMARVTTDSTDTRATARPLRTTIAMQL